MFFLFKYGTDVITFDVVYHWKGNKILIKKILSKIFRNSSGYIIRSSNIAKNNRKKQKKIVIFWVEIVISQKIMAINT